MQPEVWIGIDPGVSGAVCVLHPDGSFELHDVPTRRGTKGEVYLAGAMADLLRPYAGRAFATIETAEAPRLAGQRQASGNVTCAVKIGMGFGLWEGILAAHGIAYEVVRAMVWKKSAPGGSLVGQDKKASRARAQELFPARRAELAKRRPDFSEALLLAEFGRRRALTPAPAGRAGREKTR